MYIHDIKGTFRLDIYHSMSLKTYGYLTQSLIKDDFFSDPVFVPIYNYIFNRTISTPSVYTLAYSKDKETGDISTELRDKLLLDKTVLTFIS